MENVSSPYHANYNQRFQLHLTDCCDFVETNKIVLGILQEAQVFVVSEFIKIFMKHTNTLESQTSFTVFWMLRKLFQLNVDV